MAQIYLTLLSTLLKEVKEIADTKAGLAIVVFICCSFWFVAYTEQAEKQQDKMIATFEKANAQIVEAIKEANRDIADIKDAVSYLPKLK